MASLRTTAKTSAAPDSVPAPWKLKGDMYWTFIRLSNPLPPDTYHALDTAHYSSPSSSFKGGLGMVQVIRYSDSPVGPYDELLIIPGEFEVPGGEQRGKNRPRVSRIYVSQKETCFNGRKNWNIPKHLARFEFSETERRKGEPMPKEIKVSVYESAPGGSAGKPFFSATFTTISWLPRFPLSTKYSPLATTLVQPPLASGNEAFLAGTQTWKLCEPLIWTNRAKLVWVDVRQADNDESKAWPNVQPWSVGVCLEDADISFEAADEFSV